MPICMRINWTWDWIKNQDYFLVPLDSLNLTHFGVDCLFRRVEIYKDVIAPHCPVYHSILTSYNHSILCIPIGLT